MSTASDTNTGSWPFLHRVIADHISGSEQRLYIVNILLCIAGSSICQLSSQISQIHFEPNTSWTSQMEEDVDAEGFKILALMLKYYHPWFHPFKM